MHMRLSARMVVASKYNVFDMTARALLPNKLTLAHIIWHRVGWGTSRPDPFAGGGRQLFGFWFGFTVQWRQILNNLA